MAQHVPPEPHPGGSGPQDIAVDPVSPGDTPHTGSAAQPLELEDGLWVERAKEELAAPQLGVTNHRCRNGIAAGAASTAAAASATKPPLRRPPRVPLPLLRLRCSSAR